VNVAEALRIDREYGSIAPGRFADLVVLTDIRTVAIDSVMINGRWAYEKGVYHGAARSYSYPDWSKRTMRVKAQIAARDLQVTVSHNAPYAKVRAIAVTSPKSEKEAVLQVSEGVILPDPGQEISAIAVIERHKSSGRIGKGFVTSLYLKRGAIASTVSHDAHNLMVIGANHDDMAVAANHVIAAGGGYAVVIDGKVVFELPLPVAGIMSEEPIEVVAAWTRELISIMVDQLGCPPMQKLLLRMNGLSLPNIPNYGFTDHGMIYTHDMRALEPVIEQGDEADVDDHFAR
jgi:adenine deaminase